MNLQKFFEMQSVLDKRILDRFPELKNQNNLDWKILALQVELGELANEWRGFKKWSEDQKANTEEDIDCFACDGTGDMNIDNLQEAAESMRIKHEYMECEECNGTGVSGARNPLLEEYVDCLHFILSIGLELEATDIVIDGDYTEETTTKTLIAIQSDIIGIVDDLETDIFNKFAQSDYETLFSRFIGLGELQLGFTWEQIEEAYSDKNKLNHERQANNY